MMGLSRKLQEIVDAISKDRELLLAEVEGLTEAQLDYRPSDDHWAISDVLHHLALSDEANAKLFALMASQAREKELPADPTPDESVLGCVDHIKQAAANQKARAPERVKPRSHLPAQESLARLHAARAKLIETVAQIAQLDLSSLTYKHPFFDELNAYQWLLIGGWHEGRHVAQIGRIKSHPGFPSD
ncbi:MAG TPA: DinB family protein [Blastocatellia bacterium]|nr:DinB family protein [Blastocatellia bacterium]